MNIRVERFNWEKKDGIFSGWVAASDIGLRPGQWPTYLWVKGETTARLFLDQTLPHPSAIEKADAEGRYYTDRFGVTIHIFND